MRRWPSLNSLLLAIIATTSLLSVAVAQSAIGEWCSLPENKPAKACNPQTSCQVNEHSAHLSSALPLTWPHASRWQTSDNWWSSAATCWIPGDLGTYPANYDINLVCGVNTSTYEIDLVDAAGNVYGSVLLWRSYQNRLLATVALVGSNNSQWFMRVPSLGKCVQSALHSSVDLPNHPPTS